jgi:asparagine synthase (glutamine-hydrolysing)
MCGIVGIACHAEVVDVEKLSYMRDSMRHRGPDDAGVWRSPDCCVGLAHRRLAIIDLSPGGHQPMEDASGDLCITYNGEIYNFQALRRELEEKGHRFHTASDTEVILEAYRAWGTDCLTRFNGMFAFGLYDARERRLFLARDRAGEKPLFYYQTPKKFLFASELKAFMADPAFPRVLDLEALNCYLAYGYVPGEMCILKGVRKLAAGQALSYDLTNGEVRTWRYWELPASSPQENVAVDDLIQELQDQMLDSVRLRLIADVPVGILLSGGLDSSLVTALAAQVSSAPVKTFTVSFPGHGAFDEGPFARLVAQHFGTEHRELVAEPASVELLPQMARQYDEPLADHSMLPTYLLSKLVKQEVTVALGGDGGDELFGGYRHYNFIQQQERWRLFIPSRVRSWLSASATRLTPLGLNGRNYLIGFGRDLPWSIAHVNLYFDWRSRKQLLSPLVKQGWQVSAFPEASRARLCLPGHSALQQLSEADFLSTMVDDYLVKVDRASMLCSLEVRTPFLDHRIVEFAFGRLPDNLRATRTERKVLLRRLGQRLLPPSLDLKRKQGFTLPLENWLKGQWGDYFEEVLREADPNLFAVDMIRGLISGQRRGYKNANRLFLLTIFELWRRDYRVAVA